MLYLGIKIMPWIVVILENPEPALRGWMRMRLPEMPGMVFAGRVHGSVVREIIGRVKETSGKATWLRADSRELGFKVEMVGHKNYQVMDCDGWHLMARRVTRNRKT